MVENHWSVVYYLFRYGQILRMCGFSCTQAISSRNAGGRYLLFNTSRKRPPLYTLSALARGVGTTIKWLSRLELKNDHFLSQLVKNWEVKVYKLLISGKQSFSSHADHISKNGFLFSLSIIMRPLVFARSAQPRNYRIVAPFPRPVVHQLHNSYLDDADPWIGKILYSLQM